MSQYVGTSVVHPNFEVSFKGLVPGSVEDASRSESSLPGDSLDPHLVKSVITINIP